ncbi:MAG: MFS transporter [Gemmatimonadetes bacterium]|nr:MFS transporter [Gemmatimonadota bacterium]
MPSEAQGGSARGAAPAREPLSRTVRVLAAVSLLTDVSSEMIYPLLPVFLTATLGVSAGFVGVVEGLAETTAAMLKLLSGWWSDRVARRKPFLVAGYGLAALARPLVALASAGAQVLAIRMLDRVGKGLRSAPRDALLADAAAPGQRGRAFGFHRMADNMGAVIGPMVAFALMRGVELPVRGVFWLAAIPGALSVALLLALVPDRRRIVAERDASARAEAGSARAAGARESEPSSRPFGGRFWGVLAAIFLFALGNSTDAFLLLRAAELGVPLALVPLVWAAHNAVKALASYPGGSLSDQVGRRPVLLSGWVLYAGIYAGFAAASHPWHAWALFVTYGVVFGLSEGTERALVADIAPHARRGAAYGWFNFAVGLGALPASIVFGLLWNRFGSATAFMVGGALAVAAALVLAAVPLGRPGHTA